jgi:hypothetical protein
MLSLYKLNNYLNYITAFVFILHFFHLHLPGVTSYNLTGIVFAFYERNKIANFEKYRSLDIASKPICMNEIFLIYLWENKLLSFPLETTDGQTLEVLYPGIRNQDSGPDFFNARIRIGTTLWAGNIEMHINSSDWYRHRHHNDAAYQSIVLHVVYSHDKEVFSNNSQPIPTLELAGRFDDKLLLNYRRFTDSHKWMACEAHLDNVQRFTWLSWLDRLIVERLEDKTEVTLQLFEKTKHNWEEVFYHRLLQNFGFGTNEAGFELLASKLPLNILLKHADKLIQVEALLFGQAGLLEDNFQDDYPKLLQKEYAFLSAKYGMQAMKKEMWKFMRMRPVNFPTVRLAQLAGLIHKHGQMFSKFIHAANPDAIKELLTVSASAYWNNHYRFDASADHKPKPFGDESIRLVLINSVTQVLFAYGKYMNEEQHQDKAMMILESMPPENNAVIKSFAERGVQAVNALQTQAILHLRKNYCKPRRCLECRIGQLLIRSTEQ